jgi:hypothetical protein
VVKKLSSVVKRKLVTNINKNSPLRIGRDLSCSKSGDWGFCSSGSIGSKACWTRIQSNA